MRTALLAVTLLCLSGCWKTIHEAAAPATDPLGDPVAGAPRGHQVMADRRPAFRSSSSAHAAASPVRGGSASAA